MIRLTEFRRGYACSQVEERLEAFALEALPSDEARRVELHAERCAACRSALARTHELVSLLPRALAPQSPPPDVLVELLHRVRKPRRSRRLSLGVAAASLLLVTLGLLASKPLQAVALGGALVSPEIAVINLFAALDSPLTARYEYRTAAEMRFDSSVGRLLFNVRTGEWSLLVHGLPRPPRGARYTLSALVDETELELGSIDPWVDGVARHSGTTPLDLTRCERLSLQLVSSSSRLRLLEAVKGAW
jgi:anti-sigma factor RsiW